MLSASLPTAAGESRHGSLKRSSTAFVLPADTDMSARSSTRSSRSCSSEVQEDFDFQQVLAYVNRSSHRQERSIDSIQQVGVGHISVLLDRLLGRLEDLQSGVTGPWACSTCSKVNAPLCSACISCKHTRDEVGGARTSSNSNGEQGVRSVWMRLMAMDLKYADLLQADIARALRGSDRAVLLDLLDYLLRCNETVDELRLARGAAAAAALSSSSSGRAVSRMPAPWQQSSRALLCGAASPLARGRGGSGSSSGSDSGDSSSDARSPERCRRHRGAAASASGRSAQEPPLPAASPIAHGGDAHAIPLSRSCAALLSAPPPAAPPVLCGESSSERTSSDEWRTGLVDKLVQRAVQKAYGAGSGDGGGGDGGSGGGSGARKAAPFGGMAPMSSMAMSRRLSVKTPPRPRGGSAGDGSGGNAKAFKVLGISVGGGVDGGSAERGAAAQTAVAAAGGAELIADGAPPLNSGTPGGGVGANAVGAAVETLKAPVNSDGVLMSTRGSGDAARSSGGDVQSSSSGDGVISSDSSGGTSESQQPTVITPSASPLLLPQQQEPVEPVLVTARQHSDNTGSEGGGSDSSGPHSAGGSSSNTKAMQMGSSAADAADLSQEHATPVRSGSRPDSPIIATLNSQQQQAAAEVLVMTPVTARQQRSGAASSSSSSVSAPRMAGVSVTAAAGDAGGLETPHSISSSLGDSTASGSASKALRVLGVTGSDASTALGMPSIGGGSVGGGSGSVGSSSSNAKALKMLGISASELGDTLPPSPPLFDGCGAAAASSPRRRRMWQRNAAPGSGGSGARDRKPGTSNSGVAAAAAAAAAAAVAAGSSGLGARAQLAMWRARGRRRSKDKAGDGAATAAAPAAAGEAGGGVLLPAVGASSAAAGGAAPPSKSALASASAAHGAAPAAAAPAASISDLAGSSAQASDASTARGLDSAPPQPPSAAVTQLLPPRDGRDAHVADKLAAVDASKTAAIASAVSTPPPFGGSSRDCWQPAAAAAAGAEPQSLSDAVLLTPTLQVPPKSPPSSPPSVLLPLSAASTSPSAELPISAASLPALAEPEAGAASPAAPPAAAVVPAADLDCRGPTSADSPASNPETLPMSQPVTVDLPTGGRSLQASSLASDLGSVPGQLLTQFSSADLSSEGHSYHTIALTMELPLPPSPAWQAAASPAPGGSSGSTAGKTAASSGTGSISDAPAAAADATAAGTASGWGGQPPELPAAAAAAAEPPLLMEPRLLRANASAMELSGWQPPRPQRQATSPTVGAPPVSLRSDGGGGVAALEQVATAVLDRDVCDVAPGELGATAAPAAASAAASGDPYAELSADGAAAADAEPSAAQRGKQAPLPLSPLPPAGAVNAKALRTLGISSASASGSPIVGRTAGGSNAKALKMLGISGGDAGAAGGSTHVGPRVAMASPLRGGFTTRDNIDEMPAYYRQRLMASQSPRPLPPQARSAAAAGGSGGGGGALGRAKSRLSTALPSRSFELGSGAGIRAFGGRRRTAASSSSGGGGRGNSGAQPPSRAAAASRSGGGDAEEAARETRSYSSDAEGGRERSGSRSRARNAVAALNLRLPPPTARQQSAAAAAAAAAAAKLAAAALQEAPAHTVSSMTTEEEALSEAVIAQLQEQQAPPMVAARGFDLQSPPRSRQQSSQRGGASPASSSRAAVRAVAAAALLRAPADDRRDAALLRVLVTPVSQPDTNGGDEEPEAYCMLAAALAMLCDVRAVPAAAAACRAWRAALAPRTLPLLQRAAALRGVPEPLRAPLYRHFAFAAAPTPAQRAAAAADADAAADAAAAATDGSASGAPSDSTAAAAAAAAAAPSPWLPGCVSQDAFAQLVRAGEAAAEAAFVARDVPRAFGRSTHRRARSAGGGGGAVSVLGGWGAGRSALEEQLRQWEEEEQVMVVSAQELGRVMCAARSSRQQQQQQQQAAAAARSLPANAAFERVPLGLRRRALANVLYAAIGASSAEGYCQGQDRVVGHLMRVCSAEPLDDGSGAGAWDDNTIDDDADDAPPGSPPPSLWSLLWEAPVVAPAAAPAPIVLHPEPGGARAGRPIYELYASLFEAYRLKELYAVETAGIMVCVEVFLHLMAVKLPALAAHLADLDFSLDLVVFGWFQTLLCAVPLPHATRARVFDWWLTSGELSVFFRAGLALLELNEDALLCREFDGVAHFLATFPDADGVDAMRVMRAAHALPLPAAELMMIEEAVRHVRRDQVALPQQLLLRPGPFHNVTSLADASAGVC
ncbi:hypothetical protein JKP88DRAFT_290000 [Tribonema minus]|uniref:RanBP2-type domain-containing protein n=1 Tax=Tribonema minus TaxID=303371 RepID=A0A835Z6L5_9STRA|nr:hypothetical protein JKP88DRAFT_290000 [Tribonema minus]